ncbi:MAG: hypothetical protein RJS97_05140 [Parvibaculaceae bacterium]
MKAGQVTRQIWGVAEPKTVGRGFESCCPCHLNINDLAENYGTKSLFLAIFATNIVATVTRRNPPLSALIFFALWQICGKNACRKKAHNSPPKQG